METGRPGLQFETDARAGGWITRDDRQTPPVYVVAWRSVRLLLSRRNPKHGFARQTTDFLGDDATTPGGSNCFVRQAPRAERTEGYDDQGISIDCAIASHRLESFQTMLKNATRDRFRLRRIDAAEDRLRNPDAGRGIPSKQLVSGGMTKNPARRPGGWDGMAPESASIVPAALDRKSVV